MTFLSKFYFSYRKLNFQRRNLRKISSDVQWNVTKDSSFRIFNWENFLLRILQNRELTATTCCEILCPASVAVRGDAANSFLNSWFVLILVVGISFCNDNNGNPQTYIISGFWKTSEMVPNGLNIPMYESRCIRSDIFPVMGFSRKHGILDGIPRNFSKDSKLILYSS